MATKAELANAVLQDLLVVAAGEPVAAADQALVEERYDREFERLLYEGDAYWDIDSIPDEIMPGLTQLMKYRCANAFGLPMSEVDLLQGTAMIKRMAAKAYDNQAVKAVYY